MGDQKISQFIERYELKKPMYQAWGEYIKEFILGKLKEQGYNEDAIIKIPVNVRVKSNDSIIAKAFFRAEKSYSDPLDQITDKVGIRFVVMVEGQIRIIQEIIECNKEWEFSKDVDYEENKEKSPELFSYQSVHYIVRNKNVVNCNDTFIEVNTPCEIQIRTLEQHAYAELSHDYVYKSDITISPFIKRNLAKSMALNETTDSLFSEVYKMINEEKDKYTQFMQQLQRLYPFEKMSSKINKEIYDNIESLLIKHDISDLDIQNLINENEYIINNISERQDVYLFMQPVVLVLYYLVNYHRYELNRIWDYPQEELSQIYVDLGISDDRQ